VARRLWCLSWAPGELSGRGTFSLSDPFGGEILDVDMTEESEATVNSPLTRINLTVNPL
jgi:hypothetical protein